MSKFIIAEDGKNVGHHEFSTRVEAEQHLDKLKARAEFYMNRQTQGHGGPKDALELVNRVEIFTVTELEN